MRCVTIEDLADAAEAGVEQMIPKGLEP